ncbi:hypothetical protein ACHAQA_005131 [Verticillium albo-atrum]
MSTTTIHHRGTSEYDQSRSEYFNRDETLGGPGEIHIVRSVDDVAKALCRAKDLGISVGVRSGGHLPSKPSLFNTGILIDMKELNREVVYDPKSEEVAFGPAVRVYEAWKATDAVGRFFPFGHAPDVALGGFCLAGGQGFFMRGWGPTIKDWIVRLEMVMPDGQVLIASKTENKDLFWAARGGGQAFFGVVTRFWSRTIPKKKLFSRSFIFNCGGNFQALLSHAFERNNMMPKLFTEAAVCVLHPELFGPDSVQEAVPESSSLLFLINVSAYADSLTEAEEKLNVWDEVPEALQGSLAETKPVAEDDWEEFFQLQHRLNPQTPTQKWAINSILNDPHLPRSELIAAIEPAMCNLPTRSSYGCIYMADFLDPDESDAVLSIPQQYYISTFTGWKEPSLAPTLRETMRESYQQAETVACGIYIADFDQTKTRTHSPTLPVWTESARKRFMAIKSKWDPGDVFTGYRAFLIRGAEML